MKQPLMRREDVLAVVPLGRTQFDLAVREGGFPRPIKLTDGGRRVAWVREEVDAWLTARRAARDEAKA